MASAGDTASTSLPLQILVIADDKAGHQNQSLGLAQAIARHRRTNLNQTTPLSPLEAGKCLLQNRIPEQWQHLPRPDLIISTGSGTHLSLLAAGKVFPHSFTTLLCTSALPSFLFDLNVVPEHDNHRPGKNIIYTKGVLNKVCPSDRTEKGYGLILIGGESKHYRWNNRKLIDQIESLIEQSPETNWHLTNSRRTPEQFNNLLRKRLSSLTFHPWQETPAGWLPEQLARAEKIWVTPDSVSMVYESLTSGNQVYLFNLRSRNTRVAKGIEKLRGKETGYLKDKQIVEPETRSALWESDRVAQILLTALANQPAG